MILAVASPIPITARRSGSSGLSLLCGKGLAGMDQVAERLELALRDDGRRDSTLTIPTRNVRQRLPEYTHLVFCAENLELTRTDCPTKPASTRAMKCYPALRSASRARSPHPSSIPAPRTSWTCGLGRMVATLCRIRRSTGRECAWRGGRVQLARWPGRARISAAADIVRRAMGQQFINSSAV